MSYVLGDLHFQYKLFYLSRANAARIPDKMICTIIFFIVHWDSISSGFITEERYMCGSRELLVPVARATIGISQVYFSVVIEQLAIPFTSTVLLTRRFLTYSCIRFIPTLPQWSAHLQTRRNTSVWALWLITSHLTKSCSFIRFSIDPFKWL